MGDRLTVGANDAEWWMAHSSNVSGEAAGSWWNDPVWKTLRRSVGGHARTQGIILGYSTGSYLKDCPPWELQKPVVQSLEAHAQSHVGQSQCSVPCFEQHAFQKQLAVTLHVGLVQPHWQVAQGEVVVHSVCQLFNDGALQEEFLPVHVRELAGNLIWNKFKSPLIAVIQGSTLDWGWPATLKRSLLKTRISNSTEAERPHGYSSLELVEISRMK